MGPLPPDDRIIPLRMTNLGTDANFSGLTASIVRVVYSGISDGSQDQTFTLSQVGECTFVVLIPKPTCLRSS